MVKRTNEMLDNDILVNLLTKCSSCKLKTYCDIHNDRLVEMKKSIEEFTDVTMSKQIERPNDSSWYKLLEKECNAYIKSKNEEFDKYLASRTCDYEKKEVVTDLEKLQSRYDLKDARVYLLVKQYLRQQILDFRAYKESARTNMITYRYTEDGSRIPMINPMLNYKLQSGNFITKLILDLDKITKEDKLIDSIEINNSRLFTDYLSKIGNVKQANYKELKPKLLESSEDSG